MGVGCCWWADGDRFESYLVGLVHWLVVCLVWVLLWIERLERVSGGNGVSWLYVIQWLPPEER